MAHDVFISYSSKDKPIADGICANLEVAGIRCWIAPRDIAAGEDWPTAITTAISNSKVMVLVFSASSNSSSDVSREIILAANENLTIIPFKIEDVKPEPGKQYYLARTHWLEAMNPPTMEQIQALVDRVKTLVPAVGAEGYVKPAFIPVSPQMQPFTTKKRPFRWGYLGMMGVLVLAVLGVLFWPKFQGILASLMVTPTLKPTNTSIPTSTLFPTVSPTESLVPTTTPTTGTVTGQVNWGSKPYEGVTLLMCPDPIYGECKGLYYETITDTQGSYTFTDVEPGSYIILPSVPGELDIHLPYWDSPEFQVLAGETLLREDMQYVKYNFNVYTPVKKGDNSITLHWSASSTASYWCTIRDVYFNEYGACRDNINSTPYSSTSKTTEPLPPGNYFYIVCTNLWGDGDSCGVGRFAIP